MTATVEEYFARNPRAMTMAAARDLGIPEAEVVRALPGTAELRPEALEEVLRCLEPWGRCHVIVTNRGATLESRGVFGGFSRSGPFLNVETDTLDMHLRPAEVRALFCVEKPNHVNGKPIRMVQLYDAQGDSVMKVVLPAEVAEADYRGLASRFGKLKEASA